MSRISDTRTCVRRLPVAVEGEPWPYDLPPQSVVLETWILRGRKRGPCAKIRAHEGRSDCCCLEDWEVTQRLATPEDIAAHDLPQRPRPAIEPAPAPADPLADVTADLIGRLKRLQEQPPPAFRTPPDPAALERERVQQCLRRANLAGVPAKYLDALRASQDRPALAKVKAWARSGKQGLLLWGANQAGKSVAAAAWISTVDDGAWATASDVGLAVQPDAEGQSVVWLRRLRKAGGLVVDNIGESCGLAGLERIEALIVAQLAAGHRVVLTTDLHQEDLFHLFGKRISSRWKLIGEVERIEPYEETTP